MWGPLVNYNAGLHGFVQKFDTIKFGFLDVPKLKADSEAFETCEMLYEKCRDKMCEVLGARALSRPVPAGETLESLKKKAWATIEELDGIAGLPITLNLQLKPTVAA